MHIMLDLETLGTRPGSVIASIGAVEFDPNSDHLGEQFYVRINPKTCVKAGLTMDPDTVLWWLSQSDEARKSTFQGDSMDLENALGCFSDFISRIGAPRSVRIWGNGSDFDNVLLAGAYTAVGYSAPWSFSKNRCFRTIKNLAFSRSIQIPEREGTHHNALDDAIYQARCLQAYASNLMVVMS